MDKQEWRTWPKNKGPKDIWLLERKIRLLQQGIQEASKVIEKLGEICKLMNERTESLREKNRSLLEQWDDARSRYVEETLALSKENDRLARKVEEQRAVIGFYASEYHCRRQSEGVQQDDSERLLCWCNDELGREDFVGIKRTRNNDTG